MDRFWLEEAAVQLLRLDSESADVRRAALEWLAKNPSALGAGMGHESCFVREKAVEAAGELGRADLVLEVIKALDDVSPYVEKAAEHALLRLKVRREEVSMLKSVEQGRREREAWDGYVKEIRNPNADIEKLRMFLRRVEDARHRRTLIERNRLVKPVLRVA